MRLLSTKIFLGFLVVIILLTALILLLSYNIIKESYFTYAKNELKDLNSVVALTSERYIIENDYNHLDSSIKSLGKLIDNRITIIDTSGNVIADSESDIKLMDNHLYRPEIQESLKKGTGVSIRFSNTVKVEMIYVSKPIYRENKIIGFTRISLHLDVFEMFLLNLNLEILKVSLITMIISLFGVIIFSRSISKPINQLIFASRKVANGDFDVKVKIRNSKDELNELSNNFNTMTLRIKKLFDKLNSQTEKINTLISSVQDGFVVLNSKNEITLSNIGFQNIVGISNILKLKLKKVINNNDLEKVLIQIRNEKGYLAKELIINNKTFLCSANYIEIRDEVVLLFHDISELKKLEIYKKDFITNVSHELRTPLTAIKGFIETLEEESTDEQLHYISIIKRNTDRLINIVNDLLMLSELENQSFKLNLEKVNIVYVIDNVIKLFEEKAANKFINIQFIKSDNINCLIHADSFRIEQVLINLIDNAIKYTDKGSITLNLTNENTKLCLSISDTGIGIPESDISRIFERFYLVDKSRSRKVGGTGLGLSIVKHIVMQHKGEILIESKLGIGTKFTIYLPLA
jgi:two-component system phosphate regulon sensor histidine kinase PhoR